MPRMPIRPASGSRPGVVVGNPGALRWMRPMASAFADAGMLRTYVTTLAAGPRLEGFLERFPERLAAPVQRELELRPVPTGVGQSCVARTAALSELARVALARASAPAGVAERATRVAAERFDRGLSRRVRAGDAAVVGPIGMSLHTFRRARRLSLPTVLDYPTAHHAYARRLLTEEARLKPEYAGTLQFHALSLSLRARLEEELALADRIIVLGSFQHRTFVESGVAPDKLVQIPLGVELDQFVPIRTRPERPSFRVLFAGQLTQRKGLSYLVEGFRQADIPESELTLLGRRVGTGSPWEEDPSVRQVGHVPFPELPGFYHRADAFVLPSLIEGFPQTALQAMASGLPTIVSENTFGEDVITDGVDGYVVPIRDAAAIAERLRTLAADSALRERMGIAARARAEEFSWERYGQSVVAAVRELA